MKTRTIEIERKQFTIECEVKRDGTVVEAKMRAEGMESTPIECLEAVKASKELMFEIEYQVQGIDWDDHGDFSFDTFKDELASIVGVKHG